MFKTLDTDFKSKIKGVFINHHLLQLPVTASYCQLLAFVVGSCVASRKLAMSVSLWVVEGGGIGRDRSIRCAAVG